MDEIELRMRLEKIEILLGKLLDRGVVREHYSCAQFGEAVGLSEFTIREHARLGRLLGVKQSSGRGAHCSWTFPREELLRFEREGLLPLRGVPLKG